MLAPAEQRPPPHNIEAEQALLGAILVNNEVIDQLPPYLESDHFYEAMHGRIFETAVTRYRSGQKASPVTLKHEFEDDEAMAEIGGTAYMARLAAAATTVLNAPEYARIIYQLAIRRELIWSSDDVKREAYDFPIDGEIVPELENVIDGLGDFLSRLRRDRQTRFDVGALAQDVIREVKDPAGAQRNSITTGLTDLDELTGGFERGEFTMIGGRPSMGKSAIATAIALRSARAGHGQCFFSLEMTAQRLTHRCLADLAYTSAAPIDYQKIHKRELNADEIRRLQNASDQMKDLPFQIEARPGLTVAEIEATVRHVKRVFERQGQSLDVVWIDYLQLIKPSKRYAGQRYSEVTEISNQLMELSKKLDVALVALSQLSRQVEQRNDKRPQLSDLRDSGSLEQDADCIFFVYRHAYYLEREGEREKVEDEADRIADIEKCRNVLELIAAKQRSGPCRTVKMFCDIGANHVGDLTWP